MAAIIISNAWTDLSFSPITETQDVVLDDNELFDLTYIYDTGTTTISGTVYFDSSITGTTSEVVVRLHDSSWNLIRSQTTATDGTFSFTNMADADYYLTTEDASGTYTPVAHKTSTQTDLVFSAQTAHNPSNYAGTGQIYGTVKDSNGDAISGKYVVLLEEGTYIKVAETTSAATTGYYEFTNLSTTKYFTVVVEDGDRGNPPTYTYNDVIRAHVQAAVP